MKRRQKANRSSTQPKDLLFEIGAEEMPAAYLPGLIEQLAQQAEKLLSSNHLVFKKVENYATPRRLVLIVRGLSAIQQKPGEELRGPSKQAAFDSAGKPTQALLGFLKSQGGHLSQVKTVSSPKGEYVYLIKPPTTISTTQVLPVILPQLISSLRTPKTMRWDSSGVRFTRPIRWLLVLYGSKLVRVSFGLVNSNTQTLMGRPQQLRSVRIASLDAYLRTLRGGQVILDHQLRRQAIEHIVAKTAKAFRGSVAPEMITHGLLDEVTFLTEQPVALVGEFDRKYLALPREVLLASMAKHQRVFAIESSGSLLARCIAVLEGQPKKPSEVRKVIERILNARLADSLLFWAQDCKRSINQMSQQLSGVTFHEKLGSMAEKSERLQALSEVLAQAWQLSQHERKSLKQASRYAKADLVSTMVKEFPTLQGVMGKNYARQAAETTDVAQAIEEHYLPLAGKMPATLIGSALAIIDKYDTLSSYFSVGITPTGDQDPFGLRRAAQGIVEVAWKIHRPLSLNALFDARAALPQWGKPGDGLQPEALRLQVQRYILERLYSYAWAAPAPSVDCIEAVLSLYQNKPCDDLVDAMDRIVSLQHLSGNPNLLKAAKVIERTRNILKGARQQQNEVDPARLEAPQEKRLWEVYQSSQQRISALAQSRSYNEATTAFGEAFFEPLHDFFDQVMVNVPQQELQQNRLALMRAIHTLYTDRIADLSKLSILQQT